MSDIPDNHETNMEFLQKVHDLDEAASRAIGGIDLIENGGVYAMRATAITNPRGIIEGFLGLRAILRLQRQMIKGLVEENTEIMDRVEQLVRKAKEESDGKG